MSKRKPDGQYIEWIQRDLDDYTYEVDPDLEELSLGDILGSHLNRGDVVKDEV